MKKRLMPLSLLAILTLAACTPAPSSEIPSTPSSSETSSEHSSEVPSSEEPSSSEEQEVTFKVNNPQSGLGNYELTLVEDDTYELTVVAIEGASINEIKINDETVTLDAEGSFVFDALNGENTISIKYNEPVLNEATATSLISNHLTNKTVTNFDYVYRTMYLNTIYNVIDTDEFRKFSANLYTNGIYADVTIGETNSSILVTDPTFSYETITEGMFVTYQKDEDSYIRALVPEIEHEEGYVELLERNMYFDETSEDLGYFSFFDSVIANFSGEYSHPQEYGYTNSFEVIPSETSTTIRVTAHAVMTNYYPEELHHIGIVIDNTSYEITDVLYDGIVYRTNSSSDVVTVLESHYQNIVTGTLVEGDIPEVTNTDTIPERYNKMNKPEIQTDIADGELSKEDTLKIFNNIWAYAENTKQATCIGPSYAYDQFGNEIEGMSELKYTAYKDYFLVIENKFTPNDTKTYGGTSTTVTQKRATSKGVQNVSAVNGKVDPSSCYKDDVTPQYSLKKNFSASPLAHDFIIGICVNEAIYYGLTTFVEIIETTKFSMIYDDFSAVKDGGDIVIKWSAAAVYNDEEPEPTYYQIEIKDNFITSMSYGESFEDCLTYNMIQGEYEEFIGTIYPYR